MRSLDASMVLATATYGDAVIPSHHPTACLVLRQRGQREHPRSSSTPPWSDSQNGLGICSDRTVGHTLYWLATQVMT